MSRFIRYVGDNIKCLYKIDNSWLKVELYEEFDFENILMEHVDVTMKMRTKVNNEKIKIHISFFHDS